MSTSREAHRAQWEREVESFKLSGLTLKAYATERSISYGSLRDWNQKLRSDQTRTPECSAVAVTGAEATSAVFRELRVNASTNASYEVHLRNGTRLSLSAGFSIERVKQLVEVLRCAE